MSELTPDQQAAADQAAAAEEHAAALQQAADATPPPEPPPPPTYAGEPPTHTDLRVNAYRLADQGRWVFAVVMDGAVIPIIDAKLGGIDDDLREAREPGYRKRLAEAYQQELRDSRG